MDGSRFLPDKRNFPFSSSVLGTASHTRRYLAVRKMVAWSNVSKDDMSSQLTS